MDWKIFVCSLDENELNELHSEIRARKKKEAQKIAEDIPLPQEIIILSKSDCLGAVKKLVQQHSCSIATAFLVVNKARKG